MADTTQTTVTEADVDINALLAQPGAESIMVPETKEEASKNSLFSRKPVDLSFLDKAETKTPEEVKKPEDGEKTPATPASATPPVDNSDLDSILNQGQEEEEEVKNKGGRKKLDKDGLLELTKKLIDKKMIVPFEDEKPLEEYSIEDYVELFEANDAERKRKLEEEVPSQFYNALPDKMKYAAKYIADGGTDLKGLFAALAESERVAELDPSSENGAEAIVRQYLQATNFGDADEIQEEIDSWKDRNELEAKASKFKPKLDAMQEQYVAYKVQEQEALRKQQQEQAQLYMKNVYEVLEPGELNGIKLDKKTQSMLYSGLTQASYPSISGKQTNLLGHLLEKYQWVDPRHDLIAEAVWLLADPEGYKAKLRESGKTAAVAEAVRKLKTEEGKKIASSVADEGEEVKKPTGLKRPAGANPFFKRG